MEITKIVFMGQTYITTDYLSFGRYDNSCEIERANVLFALRLVTDLWHGEITYDPDEDSIDVDVPDENPNKCLRTGADPSHPDFKDHIDWPHSQAPVAIQHLSYYGQRLFILEDTATQYDFIHLLEEYPLIDDETDSEVEAILQDHNWKTNISEDLQLLIVEYAKANDAAKALLRYDPDDPDDEPSPKFKEEHLKAAFWEAYQQLGSPGYFENTTWVIPGYHYLMPAIVKKLLNNKSPPTPM